MRRPAEILLVDDNPADVGLVCDALARTPYGSHLNTVSDGEEAMAYLRRASPFSEAVRPSFVMLDLNLPRRDGRGVLAELKSDAGLRTIPVVVFTTSGSLRDISRSYELGANCYLTKPGNLNDFVAAVQALEAFWVRYAALPD
ncbi:MAG TPA: response regulator [Terriglobales bacterium]|nr:response regulator [Terriglobales bacterium]